MTAEGEIQQQMVSVVAPSGVRVYCCAISGEVGKNDHFTPIINWPTETTLHFSLGQQINDKRSVTKLNHRFRWHIIHSTIPETKQAKS